VHVFADAEGFDERRVLRQMRQNAQLDLRIVGRQQSVVVGLGDEGFANLASQLGAGRDIL
jgi:hypothetical protein